VGVMVHEAVVVAKVLVVAVLVFLEQVRALVVAPVVRRWW